MATALFRTAPTVRAALRASSVKPAVAALASTTFTRGKATLPDLSCTSLSTLPLDITK